MSRNRCLFALIVCFLFVAACASGESDGGDSSDGGGPVNPPVGTIPDYADFDVALQLIEEVDCASPHAANAFADFPVGTSSVSTILGKSARVLPTGAQYSYMSFTIGLNLIGGGQLNAGDAYMLEVEFPDDAPRSCFVLNRGCETMRGFYTGIALGDQLGGYVNPNAESLQIPHSYEYMTWRQYFHLHERYPDLYQPRDVNNASGQPARTQTPADGFRVILVHLDDKQAPVSSGAAAHKIRLYRVNQPVALQTNTLPGGLPKRHAFFREEMSDSVVHYSASTAQDWGVNDDSDWYEYKLRLARFLGMRTFCKDLLEFGHNQGWQVSSTQWFNPTSALLATRWSEVVSLCNTYNMDVIPYYEYYGSTGPQGLGTDKRCVSLAGNNSYTSYSWLENFNADVTDPDTLSDIERVIDETMVAFKSQVNFEAAWIRARPSALPTSFDDPLLRDFETATSKAANSVTRTALQNNAMLLGEYRDWWYDRRRAFLKDVRDYLRSQIHGDMDVLFTFDGSEPGWELPGNKWIVNDDHSAWTTRCGNLQGQNHWYFSKDLAPTLSGDEYLASLQTPRNDYGTEEWSNSIPCGDPLNYQGETGVLMTHPVHKSFSMTANSLDTFRTQSGLACVRHYCLNEDAQTFAPNGSTNDLGYLVADMERAGPFSMMTEARAVALGDPWYLGYLASNSWNHGFPKHARKFYANYLNLPALPSTLITGVSSDPEVFVRQIQTPSNGTYYAVVNLGWTQRQVTLNLPTGTQAEHPATGTNLGDPTTVTVTLEPCELITLRTN